MTLLENFDPTAYHVALLKGGKSKEREISLASAKEVAKALKKVGFKVTEIDMGKPGSVAALESCGADVAFICLHGRGGEDGTVQGLCELIGMRYTGSGVTSSVLAMDKDQSKHIYARHGLPTPQSITIKSDEEVSAKRLIEKLGQRVVVKPAREGSAIGIAITYTQQELEDAIEKAFELDPIVVVEQFVQGMEVTVGVLGNDQLYPLPIVEIVPKGEFYDYEAKYTPGCSDHIVPARLSEENTERCQKIAIEAHRALGCRGMSRSDFIIDGEDCWLLETNTIPGMTPTSLLPDAARAADISFERLCTALVALALKD